MWIVVATSAIAQPLEVSWPLCCGFSPSSWSSPASSPRSRAGAARHRSRRRRSPRRPRRRQRLHVTRGARRTRRALHRPRCRNHARLLLVVGDLDAVTAPRLARRLANHRSIRVLDLSGVTFIDAAGLRAIVEATRADPNLAVRAPSACVSRLCMIADLDEIAGIAAPEWMPSPRRRAGGWRPRGVCVSTDLPLGSATTRRPHTPSACTEERIPDGQEEDRAGATRRWVAQEACTARGQGRRQGPSR